MTNTVLDYDKHCSVPFGSYIQATLNDATKKNTNQARTLDCVYLRPLRDSSGGHELLHLASKKVITRQEAKPIPVPESIIESVEGLAEKQGVKGLKFQDWRGRLIR